VNHGKEKSPAQQDKLLEIKVMWGGIVLDVRHFTGKQAVTVGTHPDATFKMITALPGEQTFTLVSPGGAGGHVINAERSMEMEIRRNGSVLDSHQLPSTGAVRAHALGIRDRCRVLIGQLAFVIQYIRPAPGVKSKALATADLALAKWFVVFLVVALGLWTAIQLTPAPEADFTGYIKNPARYAGMILPTHRPDKKHFAPIEKDEPKILRVKMDSAYHRSNQNKNSKGEAVSSREDYERKVKDSPLGWLKEIGGGGADGDASVFGSTNLTSLDQELDGIEAPGMGDNKGFGGLGTRGGKPGGGSNLGLGGLSPFRDMPPTCPSYSSVDIARTTKKPIKVDRDPTGTKLLGDGLSMDLVGDYMARRWSNFKFCYSKELDRDPNLWGKVTVTFTIGANGRVNEAVVLHTSLSNANVEECVLRGIRRIRFPRPHGGGEVIVTYPFLFTTTQ
jgi:TonB family protein